MTPSSDVPEFDSYATDYDDALNKGISISGEDKNFFAKGRVEWLAGGLQKLGMIPGRILDYGCGTGSGIPFLLELPGVESVLGVDVSSASLELARKHHGSARVNFLHASDFQPAENMDLAFCNGVFHHIPVAERHGAVQFIHRALRPGGMFAFWENNPWNPGTRWIMSRIPFDRDAITLTPPDARRMLGQVGFKIVRTDYLFFFPRVLGWLRKLEPGLSGVPMGAQYQILCRKRG